MISRAVIAVSARLAFLAAICSVAQAQVQVTTYHNDNGRTGLNASETILNLANVNPSTFGLLFSYPVDGQVYAQPLYLTSLNIPGKGVHNVVFIATEHNSVYAFDADNNSGTNVQPLWHVNFGPSVPNQDTNSYDINPEIGITSTPVIATQNVGTPVLYVVSKVKTNGPFGPIYTQRLHALSVTNGAELLGGPVVINARVAGVGDGSVNGSLQFNSLIQSNRSALLLYQPAAQPLLRAPNAKPDIILHTLDNILYIAFASHGDNGPYHGWLLVYDAKTLKQLGVVNTTPNGLTDPSGYPIAAGGIWQSGSGPASDGVNVYFATGNGTFNPSNLSYGDSIVRVPINSFRIADFFAPSDQLNLDDNDADQGSGGVMLLPPSATGNSGKNLLVQSGKEGSIYVLDTANLGGNSDSGNNVWQQLPFAIGGVWGVPAYFNNNVYFGSQYSQMESFSIVNGRFTSNFPSSATPTGFVFPGPTPSVSANGTSNGIVWAIQADQGYGTPANLHAYNAENLGVELYNSTLNPSRDLLGGGIKFSVPTIANGKVYVGTANSVAVLGLGNWAATPIISPASGSFTNSVTVTVTDSTPGSTIRYTLDGSNPTPSSPKYTNQVVLTASATFTARAFIGNENGSAAAVANYLINPVVGTGTGLWGAYFNGQQMNPTGFPTAVEIDPTINFIWAGNSPISGVAGTNWAGSWTGTIQPIVTGTYTLSTNSDDGVEVFVNGQLLINDYTYHAPTVDSGTINFTAGHQYSIQILYFQGGGGSQLSLSWAAPGLPMQIVPQSQLYPVPRRF